MDSREGDTNSEEAMLLPLVCPKMVRYPLARSWRGAPWVCLERCMEQPGRPGYRTLGPKV